MASLLEVLGGAGLVIVTVVVAVAVILYGILRLARLYVRVPPNRVLIVVGRRTVVDVPDGTGAARRRELGYRIVRGGGTFIRPMVEEARWLNLDTQTINIQVPDVVTKLGVKLHVEANCQVKIKSDDISIGSAAEQLLDKNEQEMALIAQRNLEGHIRGACAQLTVEDINSNRGALAERIQSEAVPDLLKLGLEVTTFTVKDISDENGYLLALGAKRLAEVKRDAAIGTAEAERDAAMKVAAAKREQEVAQAEALERDLKIKRTQAQMEGSVQEATRQAEIAKAQAERDVRTADAAATVKQAEAKRDVAYALQQTRAQFEVAEAQAELKLKQAMVEERENQLRIVIPAQKKAEAVIAEADGEKKRQIAIAEAEAEAIRIKGRAEAERILAIGKADAEAKRLVAGAYKEYNDAAKLTIIAEKLPLLAESLARPLERTEKIIVITDKDSAGAELPNMVVSAVATLPALVKHMTGQDLASLIGNGAGRGGDGASRAIEVGPSDPPAPEGAAPRAKGKGSP